MEPDLTYHEAKAKGWRILAGEFSQHSAREMELARRMLAFLAHTGGRAAIVLQCSGHFAIYRPNAEMETPRQTERRLKQMRLRGGS